MATTTIDESRAVGGYTDPPDGTAPACRDKAIAIRTFTALTDTGEAVRRTCSLLPRHKAATVIAWIRKEIEAQENRDRVADRLQRRYDARHPIRPHVTAGDRRVAMETE